MKEVIPNLGAGDGKEAVDRTMFPARIKIKDKENKDQWYRACVEPLESRMGNKSRSGEIWDRDSTSVILSHNDPKLKPLCSVSLCHGETTREQRQPLPCACVLFRCRGALPRRPRVEPANYNAETQLLLAPSGIPSRGRLIKECAQK